MAVATEHHTTVAPLDVQWVSLADVLRHVITLKRAPEVDIKSEILEAIHSGKLPTQVDRIIKYLRRPTGAPKSASPPMEVLHNNPMPPEILEIGVSGRGSLLMDWRNSKAIRRAGEQISKEPGVRAPGEQAAKTTWPRIEVERIRSSREHMLVLWPLTLLTREPVIPADAQDVTPVNSPATSDVPLQPKKKYDRLISVMNGLRREGKLRPEMQPREVRRVVLPKYCERWHVRKADQPSPRTVQRVYEKLYPKPAASK